MSLTMIMWDVQHGSATYIQTPKRKHIVIDLGAGNSKQTGFSPLKFLESLKIEIDHLTITHPHIDHIDDILNLEMLFPKTLSTPKHLTEREIRGGNQRQSHDYEQKIRKYLDLRNTFTKNVPHSQTVLHPTNNGGVTIKEFVPIQSPTANLNNHSIVTVLEYEGIKVLIPGDNEQSSWEELLNTQDFTNAIRGTSVLVASHHGRESGYHEPLFKHIQPWITLISDGPQVGTSVTDWYAAKTKGWPVSRSNKPTRNRYCITTRNDGHITVTITPNRQGPPTLDVLID